MIKKWVIPDVHGYLKTLEVLVEQLIRPGKEDHLYFLGDYIDRGPDSKGVVDYLMNISHNFPNSRFIMGNHEDFCIRSVEADRKKRKFLGLSAQSLVKREWMKYGGKETLKSFGIANVIDFPQEYINWFKTLEYYIEVDGYYLVHAGFNFEIEDPFRDKRAMIWIRDYKVRPGMIKNKTIVHGHVPVSLEFLYMTVKSQHYHFISLDNGVYMDSVQGFGNLVALELGSRELLIQPRID